LRTPNLVVARPALPRLATQAGSVGRSHRILCEPLDILLRFARLDRRHHVDEVLAGAFRNAHQTRDLGDRRTLLLVGPVNDGEKHVLASCDVHNLDAVAPCILRHGRFNSRWREIRELCSFQPSSGGDQQAVLLFDKFQGDQALGIRLPNVARCHSVY